MQLRHEAVEYHEESVEGGSRGVICIVVRFCLTIPALSDSIISKRFILYDYGMGSAMMI